MNFAEDYRPDIVGGYWPLLTIKLLSLLKTICVLLLARLSASADTLVHLPFTRRHILREWSARCCYTVPLSLDWAPANFTHNGNKLLRCRMERLRQLVSCDGCSRVAAAVSAACVTAVRVRAVMLMCCLPARRAGPEQQQQQHWSPGERYKQHRAACVSWQSEYYVKDGFLLYLVAVSSVSAACVHHNRACLTVSRRWSLGPSHWCCGRCCCWWWRWRQLVGLAMAGACTLRRETVTAVRDCRWSSRSWWCFPHIDTGNLQSVLDATAATSLIVLNVRCSILSTFPFLYSLPYLFLLCSFHSRALTAESQLEDLCNV